MFLPHDTFDGMGAMALNSGLDAGMNRCVPLSSDNCFDAKFPGFVRTSRANAYVKQNDIDMSLRPQLEALRQRADDLRVKTVGIERLSDDQLTWSPGGDRWPAALILDHLNRVHELVLPKFKGVLESAPAPGIDKDAEIKYGMMDRLMLRMMGPNSPIPVPVPPMFAPEPQPNPSSTVVPKFLRLHDELTALIDKSDQYDLNGLKVTSPVNERIRASYMAYLEGTIVHEEYHWEQLEAVLRSPGFPKA